MKKLILASTMVLGLAFAGLGTAAADCGKDHCPMGKGGCSMSQGGCSMSKGESSGCPISGKVKMKAAFFLKNASGIGLSDDQVAKIKAIQSQVVRDEIRAKADMEIFMMDIMEKLGEDKVDVEGINALMDQGAANMTAGGKKSVQAYADLKAVLSSDQKAKAKEIWKSQK